MKKRRILITGSSRGIGKAIALRLAKAGYALTLHCRERVSEAEQVAKQIKEDGGSADVLCFDVRDSASAKTALESSIAGAGPFWGVVLNAGIIRDNTFAAIEPKDWSDVIDTSLSGFYNVLHPLIMPMVRIRDGGRIVIISSVAGMAGNRGQTNYSAAKAGLIGAGKALAIELAPRGITVNSIAPGLIDTEMTASIDKSHILPSIPMGRAGTTDEISGVVAFLLSTEASYITRQVIGVNGGLI